MWIFACLGVDIGGSPQVQIKCTPSEKTKQDKIWDGKRGLFLKLTIGWKVQAVTEGKRKGNEHSTSRNNNGNCCIVWMNNSNYNFEGSMNQYHIKKKLKNLGEMSYFSLNKINIKGLFPDFSSMFQCHQ